jgi:hypothetical protein
MRPVDRTCLLSAPLMQSYEQLLIASSTILLFVCTEVRWHTNTAVTLCERTNTHCNNSDSNSAMHYKLSVIRCSISCKCVVAVSVAVHQSIHMQSIHA